MESNDELVEERVHHFEAELPQIIEIDQHRTTHKDFDGWIYNLGHHHEKMVVIEQFGTQELLS